MQMIFYVFWGYVISNIFQLHHIVLKIIILYDYESSNFGQQ